MALIIVPCINCIDLTCFTFSNSNERTLLLALSSLFVSCPTRPSILIRETLRIDSVIDQATILDCFEIPSCAFFILLDRAIELIARRGISEAYSKEILRSTRREYMRTKSTPTKEKKTILIKFVIYNWIESFAFTNLERRFPDCWSSKTAYGSEKVWAMVF